MRKVISKQSAIILSCSRRRSLGLTAATQERNFLPFLSLSVSLSLCPGCNFVSCERILTTDSSFYSAWALVVLCRLVRQRCECALLRLVQKRSWPSKDWRGSIVSNRGLRVRDITPKGGATTRHGTRNIFYYAFFELKSSDRSNLAFILCRNRYLPTRDQDSVQKDIFLEPHFLVAR